MSVINLFGTANYQPQDTDLTAIAGVTDTGLLIRAGSGSAVARQIAASTGIAIINPTGAAGDPTIAIDASDQATAEAGASTSKVVTPLRVKQAMLNGTFLAQDGTGAASIAFPQKLKARVSPSDYSGTDQVALAAAIAAAAANSWVQIVLEKQYSITSSITMPKGLSFVFEKAGSLTIASGQTVTFRGSVTAPPTQIFFGSGTVAGIRDVHPEWWGADPYGSSDSWAALTAAYTCARAASTGAGGSSNNSDGGIARIRLYGVYKSDKQLEITVGENVGIFVQGRMIGSLQSRLVADTSWTDGTGKALLQITGQSAGTNCAWGISDLMVARYGGACDVGIQIGKAGGPGPSSSPSIDAYDVKNLVCGVESIGFATCWKVGNARMIRFERCAGNASAVTGGVAYLITSYDTHFVGDFEFYGCQFIGPVESGAGFRIKPAHACDIKGLHGKDNTFYNGDRFFDIDAAVSGCDIGAIWLRDCELDGNTSYAQTNLNILVADGATVQRVKIDGQITGVKNAAKADGKRAAGVDIRRSGTTGKIIDIDLSGITFYVCYGRAIYADGFDSIKCVGAGFAQCGAASPASEVAYFNNGHVNFSHNRLQNQGETAAYFVTLGSGCSGNSLAADNTASTGAITTGMVSDARTAYARDLTKDLHATDRGLGVGMTPPANTSSLLSVASDISAYSGLLSNLYYDYATSQWKHLGNGGGGYFAAAGSSYAWTIGFVSAINASGAGAVATLADAIRGGFDGTVRFLNAVSVGKTTTPGAALDVNGSAYIDGDVRGQYLRLTGDRLENWQQNALAAVSVNYNGYAGGTTQFRDFKVYDGKTNLIAHFDGTNGRVGIGQGTPTQRLHIGAGSGSTATPTAIQMDDTYSSTAGANMKLRLFGSTYGLGVSGGQLDYLSAGVHSWWASTTNVMTLTSAGLLTTLSDVVAGGDVKNAYLRMVGDRLENWSQNSLANVVVNYQGYAGGATQFRDFYVCNGKGGLIAKFDGVNNRVGIGTTAPAEKAHVSAGNLLVTPATDPTTASDVTQLKLGESSNNSGYQLRMGMYASAGLWKGSIQPFAGGSAAHLVLCGGGGNVGIGLNTANPAYTLDVYGNINTADGYYIGGVNVLSRDSNYTTLKTPSGNVGIYVGNSWVGYENYYDANTHNIRTQAGSLLVKIVSDSFTMWPTSSPTSPANTQFSAGESSQTGGYRATFGYYLYGGTTWTGSIQVVAGGVYAAPLVLNPLGGRVGIGLESPAFTFDLASADATAAKLGSSRGLYAMQGSPGLGFNVGYAGGWVRGAGSSSHYSGLLQMEDSTGALVWYSGDAGNAGGAVTLTERLRIKQAGGVRISGLPTSASGLSTGDLWNDSGTLKVA